MYLGYLEGSLLRGSVDLHMHSTHSDGTVNPTELMRECKKKRLSWVALTDHDTLAGYQEAKQEADQLGIYLIPGVEISVGFEPGSLHILGYFMNPEDKQLLAALKDIQNSRKERNPKIIQKLQALGMRITLEEVEALAREEQKMQGEIQIGRPHFAKVLLKKEYVRTFDEAFRKYLSKGGEAYVEKWCFTSKDVIRVINEAGGIASIAHPSSMHLDSFELEKAVKKMVGEGLGAIEVYHSSHKPRQRSELLDLTKKFHLGVTGGSDFHGANKPGLSLGFLGRGIYLDEEVIEGLKNKIRTR